MLHQQTAAYLSAIEQELQRLELWSQQPPSAEAMASTVPFACDTMALEHWLQYLFLPRMQALVRVEANLPNRIAIAPMAQHVWAQRPETRQLIELLEALDELLSIQ